MPLLVGRIFSSETKKYGVEQSKWTEICFRWTGPFSEKINDNRMEHSKWTVDYFSADRSIILLERRNARQQSVATAPSYGLMQSKLPNFQESKVPSFQTFNLPNFQTSKPQKAPNFQTSKAYIMAPQTQNLAPKRRNAARISHFEFSRSKARG